MQKLLFLAGFFVLVAGGFSSVSAQAKLVVGEVSSVNSEKIVLKTENGAVDAVITSNTEYKRVSPENPSLKTAIDSTFEEIGVGDKLVVTGKMSEDGKTVFTYKVFLMTKASIEQKQAKESEEWQTRGITGKVEEINPETKEITISIRTVMGETKSVLTPKNDAVYRRYAPNSNKYSESVESSFAEIKSGDMVRALGDKSEDGTKFTAEEIVSGAFLTTAGTVTAVNPETNEITINNILTKKDVVIVVSKSSVLKEFPEQLAQRLARFQMMRASGMMPQRGAGRGGNDEGRPGGTGEGNRADGRGEGRPGGGNGGGRGMRGGSIDQMLERFPDITVADVKVGQMIAVSSTKTENAERVTAIKLLSGVEPFLTQPQMAAGGRRGNRSAGQSPGFSIPGLDSGGGFDVP